MEPINFSEFTVSGYRNLLALATERYSFASFPKRTMDPAYPRLPILWRHDVDVSVHRSLRLATIEKDMGVTATYFFLLHSNFYNLLEKEISDRVRRILGLGHRAGLHFDLAYYDDITGLPSLEQRIADEADFFRRTFDVEVEAVSFHNPEIGNALGYDQETFAGLVNTYSSSLRRDFDYISDSNGYWRFKNLFDALRRDPTGPLHVLTHPEWWTEEAMSPRERIGIAIDGRAAHVHRWYDAALLAMGRNNVG